MLRHELKRKGIVSEEEIQEELSVSLLADVQQKQTSESRALTTILASSADKVSAHTTILTFSADKVSGMFMTWK